MMASSSSSSLSTPSPLRIRSNTIRSNPIPPGRIRVVAANATPISNSAISIAADPLRLRAAAALPMVRKEYNEPGPIVSPEKLDRWIRESVTEIVKGIEEAPFLAYVFAGESVKLEREAVEGGDWAEIKRRQEVGDGRVPDGVILVEELGKEDDGGMTMEAAERPRRTWGVLVQGRGRGAAECSACYILDTCRVRSAIGASTHFCLVKAKCFGDGADVQLGKAWILP